MDKLIEAANAFRSALERTPQVLLPIGLQEFPDGACQDATLLLGYYLKTHGFGTFDYVLGMSQDEDGERYSHAWLRQGNVIVDITADQFPLQAPVIVTEVSPWHDGFEAEVPHEADFHIYDGHTVATLAAAYATVISIISMRDANRKER